MLKNSQVFSMRSWAEINLSSAKFNFLQIKSLTTAKICAVVKADAYGHGSVALSKLYQSLGADYLAVATIKEAIILRKNKITLPILILGYTPPCQVNLIYKYDLTQTIFCYSFAKNVIHYCNKYNVKIKAHIKIDSGMNRLGFNCSNSNLKQIVCISKSPYLFLEGIFSHFASADDKDGGKDFTHLQAKRFLSMIDKLKDNGVNFNIRHISNSAGILDYPEYHLDMVRPGIILYGLYPSSKIKNAIPLKQVMSVYSKIAQVKLVGKNQPVSYGGDFVTKENTRLAVVPFGYADGLPRKSRNYHFLVHGKKAKIVGRICMDQTIIDASGIDVKLGDVVTIVGSVPYCSVDFLAKLNNTINYEITCAISNRVPRIYTH